MTSGQSLSPVELSDWPTRSRRASMSAVLSEAIVEGFRRGDPDAVTEVYREYGGMVYAVALRTLGSAALAEEAAQQTFVKAWQAAQSFDGARELGPWLATIARRAALDIHRRESRRPSVPMSAIDAPERVFAADDAAIEGAADVWAVRHAIDQLPDEERVVVRLQHVDGLTHVEVAEELGVPIGTVKSRSFRAHRRLAAALGHLSGDAR